MKHDPRIEQIVAGTPSKRDLRDELVQRLEADLETLLRAHRAAHEAATHEEAKPENDKDTRALEQSYVARGQAARIEDARAGLADVRAMPVSPFSDDRPAALGALVLVDEDDRRRLFFLAPSGGGLELCDKAVQVVTTKSPLGRSFLGKRAGDIAEARAGDKIRELEIVRVV